MPEINYNPYPLGKIPDEFMRPELKLTKEKGYVWDDAREIISIFEKKVADFAGSKYAVSVDCCSHAIFLCLMYLKHIGEIGEIYSPLIIIPKHTYVSVPMQINNAGLVYKFDEIEWSGMYQLRPTRIYDAAVRWTKGMYVGNDALQIASFQIKKRVPIGKGGMIYTDDKDACEWLKLARYDGRDLSLPYDHPNHIKMKGWHYYMTPEDAARGILLMDSIPEINDDSGGNKNYPDLSKMLKNISL